MEIFKLFGSIFIDNDKANKAIDETDKKGKGLATSFGAVRDALGAVGLMAAGYLKGAIESAAKAEQTNARLKELTENQGQSWDKAKGQVDNFTKGIMKLSTYSGGEAKAALIELESRGVKLGDAMKMQNTLVDLAAGKNISLSEASGILADAYNGKTRALVGLGLATKEEIKHGISFDEVQKRINERFSGSAASQLNTYAGQMQQFHNNLNSLKSTIGSYILPYFLRISEYLNALAQKVNGMDPGTKKLIANVLGLTAVFGTLIGGGGLLQRVLGILGPTVTGLGNALKGLLGPVGLVVAVIGILTYAYSKNIGGMKDITDKFVGTTVKFLMNAFNQAKAWFIAHWPQIKAIFEAVLQGIQTVYNTVLKPILKFIVAEFSVVIDWVRQNWPLIKETISTVINAVKVVISAVLGWIVDFWKAHGETILSVVGRIWDIIKTTIDTTLNVILGIYKTVMNLITGHWKDAWNSLVNTVKILFGGIGRIVRDILGGIGDIFADIARTAVRWGENLIDGFIQGIKNMAKKAAQAAGDVIKNVKNFLGFNSPAKEGEGRHIVTWGSNMIGGFMDGIRSQLPAMQALMSTAIKAPELGANVNFGSGTAPAFANGALTINFNGNYSFNDKSDIDYFMNKAAVLVQRKR